MKVLIVESPNKIKSIKKYLPAGYDVKASGGHIMDLPKSKMGIDVDNGFEPQYTLIKEKKDIVKELSEVGKKNKGEILLATDPDREGEAISWHLANLLDIDMDEPCRVTFNEITSKGITNALKEPRKINQELVDAQQARRVLDRLVGYEISPILWHKIKSGLSAGRVQSAVTKMVVDREREIEKFVPEEYWTLDSMLSNKKSRKKFVAHFFGDKNGKIELKNEAQTLQIMSELENANYVVSDYKEGTRHLNAQPPFTTSALQQDASRKLNFTPKKTMMLAQQLYEGVDIEGLGAVGLVTYIRTDSVRIADEAIENVRKYISENYDSKYLPSKPNLYKTKKNSQDAHEAIRPTSMDITPASVKSKISSDLYKLYKLIYERFVACQMSPAKYATISVMIEANGKYVFKASTQKRVFDGFMTIYVNDDESVEKENALPDMEKGSELIWHEFVKEQHFTAPPQRYNNASLVKEMELKGIGRPATYSTIIETITRKRSYVEPVDKSKNSALKPTALGVCVTDLMAENFSDIVDVKFTAQMETSLDEVENGNMEWKKVVSEFYGPFKKTLEKANRIERIKVPVEQSEEPCPKCGALMVVRSGRFGKFLACPNYPQCKSTKPLPADEIKVPCPKCGGKLVQRISKKGKKFYGCANYPDCDFAATGLPTGEKCPQCGGFLIKGFKGRILCNNFDCKYSTSAKKETKNED